MGFVEIHPRSFSRRFGEPPTATRVFLETPDTSLNELPPPIGDPHPEHFMLRCVSVDKTSGHDGDPQQTLYTVSYSPVDSCSEAPNPLDRCDVWSIGTSGTSGPVNYYYGDDGVAKTPMNTAGDVITGLQKRRLDMRLTLAANRSSFPISMAKEVVNAVNSDSWAGGGERTWLCSGASASQQSELVDTAVVWYWQISFEFLYNADTWDAVAPNIGYNEITSTGKKRISIKDRDGNYVPTSKPLPLTADGEYAGDDAEPFLLQFQVYKTTSFDSYFGTPPV